MMTESNNNTTKADNRRRRDNKPLAATLGRIMLAPILAFFAFVATGGDAAQQSQQSAAPITIAAAESDNNEAEAFRLHAADVFDMRALLIDAANGNNGGDAFANFYQNAQIQLFDALEVELSRRGEDAILSNFAAARRADIFLQTSIGGRKAQLGAHLIGAINEQPGESVIGWQLRAYGGDDDAIGGNVGIFFRRIDNGILYGYNLFADYENADRGGFVRYGTGVEVQGKGAAAAANYYQPITDDKFVNDTIRAFSRRGFDINFRIAIPGEGSPSAIPGLRYLHHLNAEASYYHFNGKGKTEADEGFRYGFAASPSPGWMVRLFLDGGDTGNDLGGEVAYSHIIGGQQGAAVNNNTTPDDPDLFAPVWREYSQRVALLTTGPAAPMLDILTRYAQVNNTATMAIIRVAGNYFTGAFTIAAASSPPGVVSLSDPRISPITAYYAPSSIAEGIITINVHGNTGTTMAAITATTSFVITASAYSAFTAAFQSSPSLSFGIASPPTVGVITPSGGVPPYSFHSPNGELSFASSGNAATVLFNHPGTPRIITATITTNDNLPQQTPPITQQLTLTATF